MAALDGHSNGADNGVMRHRSSASWRSGRVVLALGFAGLSMCTANPPIELLDGDAGDTF
jgi:hypothetical protein